MNSKEEAQFIKMTQTPVPPLIIRLAIPTIISMLVTSIYNMADTFFVAKLGTSAAGAVGIVFSLMAIIQAVGFMIGMGSGSQLSRLLGQKKNQEASEVASTGFFMAFIFGLVLTVFGLIFIDPLMRLLGATPTILPYARDYARYILIGAAIMCASFVLNNILRGEGKAALSMIGIALGGVINIILDPVFIFGFDLGISGAAMATVLSQCISFFILLSFFLRGKSISKLSIRNLSRHPVIYGRILKTGLPSLCRQGLASIATVALNVNAAVYGDAEVAAMSMLLLSVMIGFGQGFQPVVGYNYGAKKYDRVRSAIRFSLIFGTVVLGILSAGGFIFAPWLIRLFRADDAQVVAIGTFACRAQCMVLLLAPLNVICNMLFQVIGKSGQATFVSAARQGIFFLPLIFILPSVWGLAGVCLTQPVSDIFSFLICIPMMYRFYKELRKKEG